MNMNQSGNTINILFWSLLAVEAAGSQVIIWSGIPVYHRLQSIANGANSPWR